MRINPGYNRRNVFVDIETVALDPNDEKGALSGATGRVVCIGLLIDDGHTINEEMLIDVDERRLLQEFWERVEAGDVFIGHHVFGFDLPFIRQRCWINDVRPSRRIDLRRFYTNDVIDTMQLWSNWGTTKPISLDTLGGVLGVGGKTGHGTAVAAWWASGDFDRIASYCADDVRLTYRTFSRLMFKPLPERFLLATSNSIELVNDVPEGSDMTNISSVPARPQ